MTDTICGRCGKPRSEHKPFGDIDDFCPDGTNNTFVTNPILPESVNAPPGGCLSLVRAMDLHNEALNMAQKLKFNAEVRTMLGTWNQNGQIVGWTKTSKKTLGPATMLVEVFVTDLPGETREATRSADALEAQERAYLALAERVGELEAAIEPFAAYADRSRAMPEYMQITAGSPMGKRQLTMGNCYDALAALAQPNKEPIK